jgi:predicted RNase H-like HicB family nuclease
MPSATPKKKRGVASLKCQDALSAHFEVMREIGEPIPEPNASVDYVEVAA